MIALRGADRRHLRSLAHHLEPCVHVGKAGLTAAVVASIDQSLAAHELVKVKFVDFKEEKKALAAEIAERTGSALAGLIGHNAIFYRPHAEPEKRRVRLPRNAHAGG